VAATRRLVVIMLTDMVGYTAAAQADERATLALRQEQEDLVRSLLVGHQGREVKSTGDGLLVQFESALKATECAVELQRRLHERNGRPGVTPIVLRIGIHLGDVEQQGTDIFGDAVNIAARIEPVAAPEGICISGAVYDQVRNKIPNRLEKLPPTALKGVLAPVDIYRVVLPWTGGDTPPVSSTATGLAVLPFTNISPDSRDEYIADGLTEELITVLSQLRELRVISRTSAMLYKATPKSASQIGAELGVSSLLEGSVRKAGNRLRITAQLIDARFDKHLWAKTFDRELDDVFAIQAEIAKEVAESLRLELRPVEEARLDSRPTVRPDSYLAYLRGLTLLRDNSAASLESARQQFELAISLDPTNAGAHGGLANSTRLLGLWYWDPSRTDWVERVRASAARAVELDPNLAEAHFGMTAALFREQDYAGMEREFKLALSLDPSHAQAHSHYANLLEFVGRPEEALTEFRLAEAADPLWLPNLNQLAGLLIWIRRLDEAWATLEKIKALAPADPQYLWWLADYYFARSDVAKGLEAMRRSVELEPEGRPKQVYQAWVLARSGESERARTILRLEEALPLFGQNPTFVAQVYAELGDLDECFRWLDKSFLAHDLPIMNIRLDPRYENVRQDARYQALLKKMNLA
jgi:adenylate cyclase